jgi:hypothetical protein
MEFALSQEIDRLVYDLYGLTEGEINIVEGKADTATATPAEATPEPKPKCVRRKSPSASPPSAPVHATLTPEKAYADAAHHTARKNPVRIARSRPIRCNFRARASTMDWNRATAHRNHETKISEDDAAPGTGHAVASARGGGRGVGRSKRLAE